MLKVVQCVVCGVPNLYLLNTHVVMAHKLYLAQFRLIVQLL